MPTNAQPSTRTPLILHTIGHAHIDPVWLWWWQEGFEEIRATFRSALDRMKETPDLTFVAGSVAFYKWIHEIDPDLFEEIRARVREGRWKIAGGWIIEPDCNLPGGESFVRHALYGQRFVRAQFGFTVTEAFNPDSFGHAGTFPQILKKAGYETYTFMRPAPGKEMKLPASTFWWTARDGSRILTGCIIESYNATADEIEPRIDDIKSHRYALPGQQQFLLFFGVGNHGGGPTIESISKLQKLREERHDVAIVFSGLCEYYQAVQADCGESDIPIVTTDLQHHARGCYTSNSEVKRLNRRTEHALMSAERWSSVAGLALNLSYPQLELTHAWETVLFHQFHDILAGACIPDAYDDVRDAFGSARWTAERIKNRALQKLASRIDTSQEGRSIVVFNPLPWEVTRPITVSATVQRYFSNKIDVVDEHNEEIPFQSIDGQFVGGHDTLFAARVPGLGFRTYRILPVAQGRPESAGASSNELRAMATELENQFWRIQVDPHTGELISLLDKQHGVNVLTRGLSLCVLVDQTDTWSHELVEWRIEEGRFRLSAARVQEFGACRASLALETEFNRSRAQILISIYRDLPDIDVMIRLDWRERFRVLKLAFETMVNEGTATFDIPYGCIEREKTGGEEPGQSWIDLTGTVTNADQSIPYGLAVANDCKFGYDVLGNTMRITLARSPVFAHHDPARVEETRMNRFIDQGEQTINLRLLPHAGVWQDAHIPRRAWELNEPLWVHQESAHSGDLPRSVSFVNCETENFVLTVVKYAEDRDALILRGYEAEGRAGEVRVRFPYWDQEIAFPVTPHEIKTLLVDSSGAWEIVSETNLLEDV